MADKARSMNPLVGRLHILGKERTAPTAHACALYGRVSDDRQESLPVQLDQCRRYAARLGLPIAAELSDEESGLITTRRQYQALMTLARTGTISHVVVFHSSRFGREDGEFVTAARELERLGVELHTTGLGRIDPGMVGLHAMISNMEVRNISAHVLPNMLARAERGLEMGPAHYGYRRTLAAGVREPDPLTFPIVQELFTRYAEGESLWGVTAWFNTVATMRKRTHGVKKLLADPYYAGVYVYNRWRKSKIDGHYLKPRAEWVWAEHPHPATDQATWDAVQARLAQNRNVGQERLLGPRYALTGLLHCVSCAKRVPGRPDRKGRYPIYHCPYCSRSRSIRKVEAALRALIEQIPVGPAVATRMVEASAQQAERSEKARAVDAAAQLVKLTARRARLTALYADGDLTQGDYRAALAETDMQRDALQNQTATAHTASLPDPTVGVTAAWLQGIAHWGDVFDDQAPVDANRVYRALIVSGKIDYSAGTLCVTWAPPIALLLGNDRDETDI